MILIATIGQLFCGMACLTSASRMCYAFSRDRAVPGHRMWTRLNHHRVPAFSVIFMASWRCIVTLPALIGDENNYTYAFHAVVSITVIGLYIAYVIPTFLRWRMGDAFEPGPWTLGRKYKWVNPGGGDLGDHLRDRLQPAAGRRRRALDRRSSWSFHDERSTLARSTSTTRRSRSGGDRRGRALVAAQRPPQVRGADPPGRDRRDRPGDRRPARIAPAPHGVVCPAGDARRAQEGGRGRHGRHRAARDRRHGGAAAGQAPDRQPLPRPGRSSTAPRAATTCSPSTSTWTRSRATRWRRGRRGYGDFEMKPDLDTLRPVPWHEGTVLVMARPAVGRRPAGRRLAAADPPRASSTASPSAG